MSEGWDFFKEQSKELDEAQKEKMRELKNAYKEVFSTPSGRVVYEHLKRATIDKPCLEFMGSDGVNTAIYMAWREGSNYIMRTIDKYVKGEES